MFGHKPKPSIAARSEVIVDRARGRLKADGIALSKMWHRDAKKIRRRALKMEKRAEAAWNAGWRQAKPRLERTMKATRPMVIRMEREGEAIGRLLWARIRPA
ncbi:MAG: hypothetical protein ACYDBQ_08555 [Thermoplasmatota archaeon]